MNVGFKIKNVTVSNIEEAIVFVSSHVLFFQDGDKRNSLIVLLRYYPEYIYYTLLDPSDISTDELSFSVDFVNIDETYYQNISDQKLEIPISYSGSSYVFSRLNTGQYFITSDADVMKVLDDEYVFRKLLKKVDPEELIGRGFSVGFSEGFNA